MTNYLIEGNVDFYKELSKLLKEEDGDKNFQENQKENQDAQTIQEKKQQYCLITNNLLNENCVTLECNHSFNYVPLFFDIQNQKKKFNCMERCSLKTKEIRCPYCRNIQSTLLPYYNVEGVIKVHGVNYYDEKYDLFDEYKNSRYSTSDYVKGNCCFFITTINEEGNSIETPCKYQYVKSLSFDNKTYCAQHRLLVLKKYMAEKKEKEKEEVKKAKDLAKQKAKEEKIAQKKIKEELKKQQKEEEKKQKKEQGYQEEKTLCKEIIKSGKNKGKSCCLKVHDESNLCLRHKKILSKNNL